MGYFRCLPALAGLLAVTMPMAPAAETQPWIDRPESLVWRDALVSASLRSGIPVGVLAELIGIESGFRNIKNPNSSAFGFGQQIAGNEIMRTCRLDRSNPADSIMGAALELRAKLDRTGTIQGALRAYGTTANMSKAREAGILRRFAPRQPIKSPA